MRFKATFRLAHQPVLMGCSKSKGSIKSSCHVFSVSDIKSVLLDAEVTLVAWEYPGNSLHGPASSKSDRTIIYPCDRFRCRVGCPCQLCRMKVPLCKKARTGETCGDCVDCRADYGDHQHFHRALHMMCKYCTNLVESIPSVSFVVHITKGYWPNFDSVPVSASLLRHLYRPIGVEPNPASSGFLCDKCGQDFQRESDLKRHEISKHYGEKHACVCCGLEFTRKDNLEKHLVIVHPDSGQETPSFKCHVCGESFNRKSNYQRHCRVVKHCEECSAVFCSTKLLQKHIRLDHMEFSCKLCKKSFKDKANLKRHSQVALDEDGTSKNKCDLCDVSFCTMLDLLKHRKKMHKPAVECSICNKKFSSKLGYAKHAAKKEEKPCNKCGKIFCNERDLKLHENWHIWVVKK